MEIRKGDKVKVIYGAQRGREGTVEKVTGGLALITGVNVVKRHTKQGITDLTRPLGLSKLVLICPKCQKPTQVGIREENGKKIRYCKKCQLPL
ncbi:MAG: 50S ribosomal protein L24 [Patescibacteria group bacterium]|nr:50S ribosomal protein L24 [Patescibacteria group bacterium]